MWQEWTPVELAEIVLLAVGMVLLLGGVIAVVWRRKVRYFLRLPEPPEHDLLPADLLVALLAILVLPAAFLMLADAGGKATSPGGAASSLDADSLPQAGELAAQTAGQLAAIAVLAWMGRRRFRGGWAGWGLRPGLNRRDLVCCILAYVATWPICAGLLQLTRLAILLVAPGCEFPEHVAIRSLQGEDASASIKALTIVAAVVVVPVVEELFFRGLLQAALARWWRSSWLAILFSGLVFGAFHMPVFDTVPSLMVLGIVLGYVYARWRSLTAAIVLHAIFNGKTILSIAVMDWGAG